MATSFAVLPPELEAQGDQLAGAATRTRALAGELTPSLDRAMVAAASYATGPALEVFARGLRAVLLTVATELEVVGRNLRAGAAGYTEADRLAARVGPR